MQFALLHRGSPVAGSISVSVAQTRLNTTKRSKVGASPALPQSGSAMSANEPPTPARTAALRIHRGRRRDR